MIAVNTVELNFTGHPGVSVPIGTAPEGVPIGLQIARPALRRPARARARGRARSVPAVAQHRARLRTVRGRLSRAPRPATSVPGCERVPSTRHGLFGDEPPRVARGAVLPHDEVALVELTLDRLESTALGDREVHARARARAKSTMRSSDSRSMRRSKLDNSCAFTRHRVVEIRFQCASGSQSRSGRRRRRSSITMSICDSIRLRRARSNCESPSLVRSLSLSWARAVASSWSRETSSASGGEPSWRGLRNRHRARRMHRYGHLEHLATLVGERRPRRRTPTPTGGRPESRAPA